MSPPNKKRQRLSPLQIRIRKLEREAAHRTFNGNGKNGSLPPLPSSSQDDDDGIGTLFDHPYGALPYGNIHLIEHIGENRHLHPDHVRQFGLGSLQQFNDEQVLNILSFVDGSSLAGGVVLASRFLYVAGHHEELWRDLVLRRWGEVGFDVPEKNSSDDDCETEGSGQIKDNDDDHAVDDDDCKQSNNNVRAKRNGGIWKDIYAFNEYKSQKIISSPSHHSSKNPPRKHEPISIRGIYSDTFFRSYLCRSFALQPSWLSAHTVPTIRHDDLTTSQFLEQYEQTNTPLLIKGASSSWPAVQKWNIQYLINNTKGTTFRATSGAAPLPAQFTMENYIRYCQSSTTEEAPLYLFDRTFATKCPRLLQDFDEAIKTSCPFWSEEAEHGHDLFGLLGEGRRPDYQWLIIGPKRSGSCFHIDPNCTHAWNAPIIGRKRWIFYPPGVTPPGVYPSPCGDDVCMPISLGEWFLTYWDAHVERSKDADPSKRPLECTACPGDVLFVPHGWWHSVLNIGDDGTTSGLDDGSVSVALTRNYVSASNLPDVLRFLRTRKSQISGCRDRGDAIQPDDLSREFQKALLQAKSCKEASSNAEEKKCDNESSLDPKGLWVDLYEKSEIESRKGWGCAAWSDSDAQDPSHNNAVLKKNNEHKTSILERAKLAHQDDSGNNCPESSSGGGFSFSFL